MDDMQGLVVTVGMLAMFVTGAGVVVHILRNKLDSPDLPTERANEMGRAESVATADHTTMGH